MSGLASVLRVLVASSLPVAHVWLSSCCEIAEVV